MEDAIKELQLLIKQFIEPLNQDAQDYFNNQIREIIEKYKEAK